MDVNVACQLQGKTITVLVEETLTSLNLSRHLLQHIRSSINIQQWSLPEERESTWPPDPYYLQNYAKWKQFLVSEAGTLATASDTLSAFELRSLLLIKGPQLTRELQNTAAGSMKYQVYKALLVQCMVPDEIIDYLVQQAEFRAAQKQSSFLPSEAGLGFILRDKGGAAEEDLGIINFQCITNTREPDHMIKLLTLKNIFSRQLPKMPREYITRLTFDRYHYSFCLLKQDQVIGGVCFRPFFQRKFAEIVFLAVASSEQVKGYGTRLMNHLKEFVRHRGINFFLTYADNYALGYFRKQVPNQAQPFASQGFSQRISMSKENWTGFIKDYEGGTLMECCISPHINYLQLSETFLAQRRRVHQALRLIKTLHVYSGSALWASPTGDEGVDPKTIPGFPEAGWNEELMMQRKKQPLPLNDQILRVLEAMARNETSWPFRKPVTKNEAPDYSDHIKEPMDISTMKKKARAKKYRTKAEFATDVRLMFDNCRYYNFRNSIYYHLADELETAMQPHLDSLEET